MTNIETNSALLINEPPLQVLPSLAKAIGLNEAIFVQQLHYWLGKSKNIRDGRRWVYNTYKQWREDNFPFWSERTIERIALSCQDMQVVIASTVYNKMPTDRTKWYTINYNVLNQYVDRLAASNVTTWQHGSGEVGSMLPETTTENSTKTNQNKEGANAPRVDTSTGEVLPSKKDKPAAVVVFKEVMHFWPHKSLHDLIAAAVGEDGLQLQRWRDVLVQWLSKGYSPRNVEGVLDVWAHGWKKHDGKPKAAKPSKPDYLGGKFGNEIQH